jgi:hypothetical protein
MCSLYIEVLFSLYRENVFSLFACPCVYGLRMCCRERLEFFSLTHTCVRACCRERRSLSLSHTCPSLISLAHPLLLSLSLFLSLSLSLFPSLSRSLSLVLSLSLSLSVSLPPTPLLSLSSRQRYKQGPTVTGGCASRRGFCTPQVRICMLSHTHTNQW